MALRTSGFNGSFGSVSCGVSKRCAAGTGLDDSAHAWDDNKRDKTVTSRMYLVMRPHRSFIAAELLTVTLIRIEVLAVLFVIVMPGWQDEARRWYASLSQRARGVSGGPYASAIGGPLV